MGECCYIRRIFPCFDEPNFKADFELTLVVPSKYTVTSNTRPRHQIVNNGLKTVSFEPTGPMSTYLLAFSIFENFANLTTISPSNGFQISAWVRSELSDQISDTATYEAKVLDFYSQYFNKTFHFRKLDMILEPYQGYSEEDWGQITYGESAGILNDQQKPSDRLSPLSVIAHETGHQWSGDLVTCAWWSDTWLNEGFATFIQTLGQRTVTDYTDDILWLSVQLRAMNIDSLKSTRPLVSPVANDVNTIMGRFDTITYEKGGTILSMFRSILGENTFKMAMAEYFNTFAEKSVLTGDFLSVIDKYSTNLSAHMYNWIYQAGFPTVEVQRNGNMLNLQQHPYANYSQTASDATWHIPLWYSTILSNGTVVSGKLYSIAKYEKIYKHYNM